MLEVKQKYICNCWENLGVKILPNQKGKKDVTVCETKINLTKSLLLELWLKTTKANPPKRYQRNTSVRSRDPATARGSASTGRSRPNPHTTAPGTAGFYPISHPLSSKGQS